MNDQKIIELLFARSQEAIKHLENKFGKYCHSIAYNITGNDQDAKECVNDTYLKVWDTIPPKRPEKLSVYLGHIARNISIDRIKKNRAQKRNSTSELVLEEILEIVSNESEDFSDTVFIKQAINSYLKKLSTRDRRIFIQRYWYSYSIKEIADSCGQNENFVKVKLCRLRADLKEHLTKEGIEL